MPSILRDKEVVRAALEGSGSIKETLIKLGLRAAGGNYKALIAACADHGLVVKRSTGAGCTQNARLAITRPLEEILVIDSNYSRYHLKKRLLREGLLTNTCSGCGNNGEWNGRALSLHLEHINGVYNDNRLENLSLLCPNCHSQTPTYAGRNAHRHAEKREKLQLTKVRAKRVMKTKIPWPVYSELVAMCNSQGKSTVARQLNVSEAAVRKRLRNHGPK